MHFLEIALRNSYILYSKDTNTRTKFIKFRKSVARDLVKNMRERKLIGKGLRCPKWNFQKFIIIKLIFFFEQKNLF